MLETGWKKNVETLNQKVFIKSLIYALILLHHFQFFSPTERL